MTPRPGIWVFFIEQRRQLRVVVHVKVAPQVAIKPLPTTFHSLGNVGMVLPERPLPAAITRRANRLDVVSQQVAALHIALAVLLSVSEAEVCKLVRVARAVRVLDVIVAVPVYKQCFI